MITLINKDFKDVLPDMDHVRMIFADPPDNIGLNYDGFSDKMSPLVYRDLLHAIIWGGERKSDVLWVSYNSRHIALMGALVHDYLQRFPDVEAKFCVQTFTFYQHNRRDLGNAFRPLLRLMRKGTELYPDAIRVPSWRQLNGDKRADPRGKVPGDHFDFPRVVGNSKQRRPFSPTQLHEGLYERCIKLCCKPGDTVCDLFAGSGTLGRVAPACGVNAVMIEVSEATCRGIAKDLDEDFHS